MNERHMRRTPRVVSRPDSPCLTGSSVAAAIGGEHAEAPGRCRSRAGIARYVGFVASAAAAAVCATVLALAVTPAQAQTVTIEKISGKGSFNAGATTRTVGTLTDIGSTAHFRIRYRGSDAPFQQFTGDRGTYAGITIGVEFDYQGRDLESWANSNYTTHPGNKISRFEVVLARAWEASGSIAGNRIWDVAEVDMGFTNLHLIGPVIVRLYDPPGGRPYSLGSKREICLVINQRDGTAGEPCSSSQRRSVERPRLTGSFDSLPDSHDGQTAFTFRIQFSEDIDATVDGMRDHALNVSGGTVTGAARVKMRDDLWSFTITPSGDAKVEIILAGGASCTADGAICTSDGRQLSTGLLTSVSGPLPTLSIGDAVAYEGVDDHMTFYVSMDRAATERAWFNYATADGTAEAGSDYTAKGRELYFFPGELVRWMIEVPIIDDTVDDDGETFTVTLSDPRGVTIGRGVATGTIRNSEEPVEVSVADAEATEGEDRLMRFRLSLNRIAKDVTVHYATADGTATAGVDYVATSGSMVIRKGTINTEITVPILSDSVEDDGETFTLTLRNVSGAEIADGEAVGTIRDGDSVSTIQDGESEPTSTGALWSADMSAVDFGNGSIGAWGTDKFSNVGGSGELTAKWLWYHTGDRKLHLAFTTAIADTTGLSLYIGDASVAFPDGRSDSSFSWTDVDIAWADGETVPVRIAKGGPVALASVNTSPTGAPAITGTPQVGEVLTASISDIEDGDGLDNATFAYQWLANDGADDSEIATATGSTHEVAPAEAGKTLKVRVTFTDDGGTEETLTSVATEAVAARAPDAPGGLAAETAEGREGELDVSWTVPASDGGSEVTGYKVQWKSGAESYDGSDASTRQAVVNDPTVLTHTITGLTVGTTYMVRVLAVNAAGDGAPAEVETTAEDRVVPTLTAASVNGTVLTLTFSEALDATSKPVADAFAVTVQDTARTVDAVALSGSAVTLTLASAVASGETVTVGYTVPTGANAAPLKDASGKAVAGFTGEAVTNGTPALPAVSIAAGTSPVIEGANVAFTLTRTGSIAAGTSPVIEGANVAFTLTRTGSAAAALTVTVEVTESGAVLAETSPAVVTFEAESATAVLELATADDEAAEDTSTVTVTVVAGDGWTVDADAGSAAVTVEDDDAAPVVTTASAVSVEENATAVITLAATDTDTDVASLTWSIPAGTGGGADAGALALTEAGALAFKEAKDFEAADDADGDGTYEVTVRVTDGSNPVDAALQVTLVDVDEVAPTLTAVSVNGTSLTLTFSEALDGASKPAADAFSVTVAGDARTVTEVALSGSAAELTLSSAVASGEPVTVGYTVPAGSDAAPLKDTAGNALGSFSGESVTNETPAAENSVPTGLPEISGTAEVGEVLTVSVAGIADADDIDAETFAYQWLANDGTEDTEIAGATGKTYTVAPADAGTTLKARVSFTDGGGTEEVLTSAATETVPVPLTAQFRGVPESHDGTSEFSFEVLFSEPVRVGYAVLKNQSFAVTGGTVEKARRALDENGVRRHDLREIHIKPNTQGDVTVVLAGGRACGTTGAICTADEKVLSGTRTLTVPGPASTAQPAVSVVGDASPVTEGAAAAFTLTRTGDVSAALTVAVEVTESGAMLAGDAPTEVTFEAASTTAALTLATVDDEAAEAASVLAVTVASGDGYTVASEGTSAEVTVEDDDAAPVVTTALALAVVENATAVATLEATDTDTDGEDLAWSIAGGADAGAFALTETGVLTFKASRDFEAPDDADGDGTFEVTVRVTDGANAVDAALTVSLTDVDEIAPTLTAASVNGTALTLTFSEALDATSQPAADAFAVTVAEAVRTVDAVSLSGNTVELTLALAVASGETVTVGYTVPTGVNAAPLKDAAGNDVAGFTGEAVSNKTPAPVNAVPTGLPEISGTPKVGEVLTASESAIEDADGLQNATFAWQWLSNDGTEGADDTEIAGATGATHEVAPAGVGKRLKVRVTFTDDGDTEETLTSVATEPVAARAPDAPGGLAAATAAGREGELDVSWTAPASDGGSEVTGYKVQWKSGSEVYDASASSTRQAVLSDPAVVTHTITVLTVGTAYAVRVLAVNAAGDGTAAEVEATAQDRVVPTLTAASVNGSVLTLTFSEALDADSKPAAEAFAATVAEAARTVDEVSLSGSAVTLTLASAVASRETVTVGYTALTGAEASPLKDASGNAAASFTGESVTNETEASNTAPTGLPEISGTPKVGEVLTASVDAIEDADGLDDVTFAYQWLANDGQNDTEIEDATGATHEVAPAEVGKTLKVRVTFTDEDGTEEVLTSEATEAVEVRPVEVSIAAAATPVTEGADAVFTLTRTGDASSALTVGVSVSVSGAFLDVTAPTEAGFAAGASTATLRVATANDGTAEADGRVSASVASGTGYVVSVGAGSAGVDVFDNDKAAPAETVLWSADMTVVDYETGAIGAGSADLLTNIGGSEDLGARSLWYYAPDRKLHLKFSKAIPEGDGLTLHLGSRALALPEGSAGNPGTAWEDIDIAWSDGETIAVRLAKRVSEDTSAEPGLSVADARVQEAAGAELSFRVTLDSAQSSAVSVRYATADGTAVAGSDYVTARGTVRFAPGQTSRTVKVLVLEDAHDDSGETLTLTLSSPFGAQLSDGQATGTIANTDPMPQAWLARFGRTVAGHVVDAISGRFEGSAGVGSHMTLGGQRLPLNGDATGIRRVEYPQAFESDGAATPDGLSGLAGWTAGHAAYPEAKGRLDPQTMTGREFLLRSSFHLASEGDGNGASFAAWGRIAAGGFDAEVDSVRMDGEVTTALLGADVSGGRWLAGAAVSMSEGKGNFLLGEDARSAFNHGKVESTLTGVYPYARVNLSKRVSAWGLAGYGQGELALMGESGTETNRYTTDIDLTMGALGVRGEVLSASETGGIDVALKSDAFWVRTTSDAVDGMAASEADVSRLRLLLDGSRSLALGEAATLTPRLEVGLRHEIGDAETGTAVELGASVRYTTSGITVEGAVRALVAHEDSGYEEWGASGSVRIDPSASGRGLSLTLAPSWGSASSAGGRLWSARDATELAPDGEFEAGRGFDAELGYGLVGPADLGVVTPYAGFGLASGDARTWRAGARWQLAPDVNLGLEGTRHEPENGNDTAYGLVLRGAFRW